MIDLLIDKCQICIFHVYLNFTCIAANLNVDYIDQLSMGEDNLFTSSDFELKAIRRPDDNYLLGNGAFFYYTVFEENSNTSYI